MSLKLIYTTIILSFLSIQCHKDDDPLKTAVSFDFKHYWNTTPVASADFNTLQYTNANGELLSIEKLRYLISNITFHKEGQSPIVIEGYKLINVQTTENNSFLLEAEIPAGNYNNLSFTFGFDDEHNIDGIYTDLNTASWNVPTMLGGGYHFMQLEGKFINNLGVETGYQYHAIRAANNIDPENLILQDTSFTVNLGSVTVTENTTIPVQMNIAEWFVNPNQWDLNAQHTMLMPNFDAQIAMYENGQNVFSLTSVD